MKKLMTLTAIGGFLALALTPTHAQPTNTVFVTNTVQAINVALTGFAQNGDNTNSANLALRPVRITTRDIIADLATATGQTFSSRARLMIISPPGGGNGVLVVRDISGRTVTDTDVSSFFSNAAVGQPVERSATSPSGRTTGVQYSIQSFSFGSGATSHSFSVQGFTTTTLANNGFTSSVNGTGSVNGEDAVLRGTISAGPERTVRVAQP
jgi:hypothetical protein